MDGRFYKHTACKGKLYRLRKSAEAGGWTQSSELEILRLPHARCVCLCESVYLCGYPPVLIAQYSTEEETEAHRPQTADLISGMSRQK